MGAAGDGAHFGGRWSEPRGLSSQSHSDTESPRTVSSPSLERTPESVDGERRLDPERLEGRLGGNEADPDRGYDRRPYGFCTGDAGVLAQLNSAPRLPYGKTWHRGRWVREHRSRRPSIRPGGVEHRYDCGREVRDLWNRYGLPHARQRITEADRATERERGPGRESRAPRRRSAASLTLRLHRTRMRLEISLVIEHLWPPGPPSRSVNPALWYSDRAATSSTLVVRSM
jgi:hypothetical protein